MRKPYARGSTSDLGTVIKQRRQRFAAEWTNFTQLLTLTPGVTPISLPRTGVLGCCEGNVGIPAPVFSDGSFTVNRTVELIL